MARHIVVNPPKGRVKLCRPHTRQKGRTAYLHGSGTFYGQVRGSAGQVFSGSAQLPYSAPLSDVCQVQKLPSAALTDGYAPSIFTADEPSDRPR